RRKQRSRCSRHAAEGRSSRLASVRGSRPQAPAIVGPRGQGGGLMTVALESSGAATAKERYEDRVATAIAAIARDLEGETPVVGPGDRAELRRGWEGGIGSAFWRLAARHLEPRGLAISGEEEGRWVIVAAGL